MNICNKLDCLLINLDRSPERLVQMQEQLDFFDLPFRRISAVDGQQVTFTPREIDGAAYENCHGKYVTPTEVGCYISHYNAFQAFLEGDKEYALILEDDMVLNDDFLLLLEELIKNHRDWDMVKLNGCHRACPITKKMLCKDYKLVINLFQQTKSGAYLVNRLAAHNYVRKLLPMKVPYDHEFTKQWKYKITICSVVPFPTREKGEDSTINYSEMNNYKKPWYQRVNTLVYRMDIALKRLWYAF